MRPWTLLSRALAAATFASCLIASQSATAQPAAPDPSFGTANGRVTLSPFDEVYSSSPHALALLPDGRMVIGGNCSQPHTAMCFIRLLPSGAPDPEFGNNGRVIAVNDDISTLNAIAVQSDGKLVASGLCYPTATSTTQGCVRRYLSNGGVDTGFGNNGRVNISITAFAPGALKPLLRGRLSITGDGKIILSGICDGPSDNDYLCVVRLLPSGAQDTSFGAQGSAVVTAFPGVYIALTGTAMVQPDGSVVVAGDCGLTVSLAIVPCLTRLTDSGAVDTNFGSSGYRLLSTPLPVGPNDFTDVLDLALRPDGGIILLTTFGNNFGKVSFIAFTRDGNLDTTFSATGRKIYAASPNSYAHRLLIQPDGRMLVNATCVTAASSTYPCLGRFHADGNIDPTFPFTDAEASTRNVTYAMMALQNDGKVVLAGQCQDAPPLPNTARLCAARFNGGPNDYAKCSADIDGDGAIDAKDSLLLARAAIGFRGAAVTQNVGFAAHATRSTWPAIRDYLFNHCGMAVSP